MKRKTKKEMRQRIKEAHADGQTNKEIYDKLSEAYYDEYDEAIARLVVTTIRQKDKKKHHRYIGILIGFTAVIVLFNVWAIIKSPSPFIDAEFFWFVWERSAMTALWSTGGWYVFYYAMLLITICQKRITSYIFWMYTSSILIFFLLLKVHLDYYSSSFGIHWLYQAIDLISIVFIIFLSRFFQRKIFPDYRYRRLKEDENGEYIFS